MQRKTKQLSLGFSLLLVIFLTLTFDTRPTSAFSLNITTSGPISTNVIPASDGSMGTSIVTDEVNITSNCRAGYTFTIASPSDNNLYLNGDDTNNAPNTYFTSVNGTNALNHTANTNKWGYTLTNDATSSTVFSPLSSTATTLRTTSQTASPSSDIDHTIPIHYGTAVDGTMNPGSYTFANNGTITYTVTMDPSCLNYSVQYQGNNPDNPNGMGTTDESTGEKSVRQTNIAEGTTITLLPPNFKKQGHSFLGWSTDEDAYTHFTDDDDANNPVIYGPMETVTIDSDIIATANTRNQINMYAIWLPALRTDPSDSTSTPVYFQDWDNPNTNLPHDGCSTLTQTVFDDTETNEKDKIKVSKDSVVALTDKRDNQVYTVARLADGKCWMTENLRLDAEYTRGNNINDPTVTNQYLSQGYGGTTGTYGNFVGLADSENANFSNVTTSNSIYKSSANPPVDTYDPTNQTLEDIGTTDSPGYRIPRYNNRNISNMSDSLTYTQDYTNPSTPIDSGTNYRTSSNLFSYGNYYNWLAAMANTNNYPNVASSNAAGTSICPSGWRLPTGGASGEYATLGMTMGGLNAEMNQSTTPTGDTMIHRYLTFPFSVVFSGDINNKDSNVGQGAFARITSTTSYSGTAVYRFGVGQGKVTPTNSYDKWVGFSVRCIVDPNTVEITLDSNNSNGVSRIYGTPGSAVTLPQSSIAETGYVFKNWNTTSDGSGTTYTNKYTIPAGSKGETLYAQWTPQYTIVYVNNCQSYASAIPSCTQTASGATSVQKINLDVSGNGSGALKASNFWTTMNGWKIVGWNTSADGTGTEYRVSSAYAVTGQSAGDGITLYAHWVPTYTIQYDGNGANNPNGMGATDTNGIKSVKQINVGEGDAVLLLAPNFKRAGYGFAGWSTNPNATVTSNDKIYGPMETITAPAYPNNATNAITMYAIWVEAEKDNNDNPVYLQDFTTTDCNSLTKTTFDSQINVTTPGSVIALTDKRDNEVYTIARLADGNCWMVENLRLESAGTLGNNINDSTVTNQSLSQGYGGTPGRYGSFVGLADSESTTFSNVGNSNSVYKSSNNPPVDTYDPINNVLEDIGTNGHPGSRFPRYNNSNSTGFVDSTTYTQNYIDSNSPADIGTNYRVESNVYSYGNYYTWSAAVADTSGYAVQDTTVSNASICPSNWQLPSGGTKTKVELVGTDIWEMIMKVSGDTLPANYDNTYQPNYIGDEALVVSKRLRTFPYNYVYSGYYTDSKASHRGGHGLYWSSTAFSDNASLDLYLDDSQINPGTCHGNKYYGRSIRCMIRNA